MQINLSVVKARFAAYLETSKQAFIKWGKSIQTYARVKFENHKIYKGVSSYNLSPLYPTIERKEHAKYVSSLNKATKNKKIKNLALTGHYGSGKSSILEWYVKNKRRKVVRISFSTLGANIEKYITTKKDESNDKKLTVLSNLIQKEIVKHILFNDKPSSLPNSRYKRAAKPNKVSVLLLSLLLAGLLSIVAYAQGLNGFIESLSQNVEWITYYLWATAVVTAWLTLAIVFFIGGSKIKLDKISGGPFSLSLTGETSYFDEYLDEIIYYFQATGRRIVVIEDIDRFNTLYIFENLRQLNTILNNSKQIRGRVLFVYAIKDSVFVQNTFDDSTEEAEKNEAVQELIAAQDGDAAARVTNRTKFFDLIIPVVPFITVSTSKNFISDMLTGITKDVSDTLIEIVAKHVVDMRLIKNMFNEFVVFKDKVLTDAGIQSLNDDGLFALIAYKNMYISDFENIKDGTSVLDDIDAERRKFIRLRNREVNKELSGLTARLSDNKNLTNRAKNFGEILIKYTENVASQIGLAISGYTFDGKNYTADEIKTLAFWEEVSGADLTAPFVVIQNDPRYGGTAKQQTFPKSFIAEELVGSTDFAELKAAETEGINGEIEVLNEEQRELRHLSTSSLMMIYEERFMPILNKILNDGRLGDPRLALELLRYEYIDSYYVLYTSVYRKDKVSPNAANFAIQFIHREDQQDIFYPLDSQDIGQLLKENATYLDERSMYNISIVDYLVNRQPDRQTRVIISNIGAGKYNAKEFIDEYVANSTHLFKFIARITSEWSEVFDYLVKSELIDESQRNALIGTALVTTSSRKEYLVNKEITDYIVEHASEINVLHRDTEQNEVDSLKYVLTRLNARFKSINDLSPTVQKVVIDNDLYEINESTLKTILGKDDFTLNSIKAEKENVYKNILQHFSEYVSMLDKLEPKQFALNGSEGFEDIINDVATASLESVGELLDKADQPNIIVSEIGSLKAVAWTQAIQHDIISNTFSNALDYYEYGHSENEVVDEILGEYLNNVETLVLDSGMDTRDGDGKDTLILAIVNSPNVNTDVKVNIVKDCYNAVHLDVAEIDEQEGPLYGGLLKNDSIEDSAESLNAIKTLSWGTRKEYIEQSSELLDYFDEVEWKSDDIDGIASDSGMDDLKRRVINEVDSLKDVMGYKAASDLVEYAYAKGLQLSSATLTTLFSKANGLRDEAVVGLVNLMPAEELTIAKISAPLEKLGEPYISLTRQRNRPKLDNENYNKVLLERLASLGMISKMKDINDGRQIQVNMKGDW